MQARFYDDTENARVAVYNNAALVVRLVMDGVHSKANPKTPLKNNGLRTAVTKTMQGTKGTMAWNVPYAAVQEKGWRTDPRTGGRVEFRNYTTPGTGAHFAKTAVDDTLKDISRYVARVFGV